MANPIVTIEMESGAVMSGELYPEIAPNTVNNFIALANSGFYDGVVFHRVIPGFMIQGGDPDGNGTGGPGYEIKGEFSANGFKNDLKHTLGVLSMARTMIPDSAGSQFFIMVADAPHLDGQYAAFGKITENAQAAVDISRVNRNMYNDMPKKPQVIKTIRVDTQGVDYPGSGEDVISFPFAFAYLTGFPYSRRTYRAPLTRGRTGFDGGVEAG